MAKYVPKVEDIVFMDGKGLTRYVIIAVDSEKRTVSVNAPVSNGSVVPISNIPWSKIHHLDESQNALRIVREATEGK